MESLSVNNVQDGENDHTIVYHHQSPLLLSFVPDHTCGKDISDKGDDDDVGSRTIGCAATTRKSSSTTHTAMIVLNAPISQPPSPLFTWLWKQASFHVCADGGANRLLQATSSSSSSSHSSHDDALEQDEFIPHAIVGDLDSLRPLTRQYYQERGVHIVADADQDRNDIDKAVATVVTHFTTMIPNDHNDAMTIRCVIYGSFGGRFDQEMASLQILYTYNIASVPTTTTANGSVGGGRLSRPNLQLFLYNDQTMAFLLPTGINHIYLALSTTTPTSADDEDENMDMVSEGPTCGLIPLGGPVDCVTTSGLEWNLHRQATAFGGLVSTSNRINATSTVQSSGGTLAGVVPLSITTISQLMVQCSQPLIFTAQVHAGAPSDWTE
jgi:thiamine pyrophosphokinase